MPEQGELITLEGSFLIERALASGLELEALYCVRAREAWASRLLGRSLGPIVLSEAEISERSGYPFHRGALAFARRPEPRSLAEALPAGEGRSTVLALPEIGDPENLGSAFRNAAAFGCSALLLGPSGPDPLCRRVLRVSMGSSLRLPMGAPGRARRARVDRPRRIFRCGLRPRRGCPRSALLGQARAPGPRPRQRGLRAFSGMARSVRRPDYASDAGGYGLPQRRHRRRGIPVRLILTGRSSPPIV